MAGIRFSKNYVGGSIWMHDAFSAENLLPNGGHLRSDKIPAINGVKQLPSGTLVGRRAGTSQFVPATVTGGTISSTLGTVTTLDAAAGDTSVTVENADGFAVGDAITVAGTGNTVTAVNKAEGTVTLGTALAAAVAAGSEVRLTTAVALTDLYLTANDCHDVDGYTIYAGKEISLLRHGRMVYINRLPNYATLPAAVLTAIRDRYQTIVVPA